MNYFETIKCNDEEIFNITYHEKRISRTIGKNINLLDYIYPPNNELLKCKILYNEDDILDVAFSFYKKREIQSFQIIINNEINYNKKFENRDLINELFSKKEKADEIIIVKNNLITDTSIANIAIYIESQWYTPKKPLLLGTTRQRYIDNGTLKEIDIDINLFKKAEKFALLNAMIGFNEIEDFKVLF